MIELQEHVQFLITLNNISAIQTGVKSTSVHHHSVRHGRFRDVEVLQPSLERRNHKQYFKEKPSIMLVS